ncbi:MAG: rubredoxin [Mogibacterium sp.]|nr:rubredoxin [Mogibacterium sp.]
MDLYCCPCCGYVYDPAKHDGVPFSTYDSLWECPYCSTFKYEFIRM